MALKGRIEYHYEGALLGKVTDEVEFIENLISIPNNGNRKRIEGTQVIKNDYVME